MDNVSPLAAPSDAAGVASSVVELLEVLWGGGREISTAPVSVSQLRVLYVLERNEGTNLRALTEELGSSASSVSRLCDRLEAVGFVRRSASATSRRELELHLTDSGQDFLGELRSRRELELQGVLAAMRPAARQALITGLRGFRDAAEGHPGLAGAPVAGHGA
ncbi:MarR family winged helix-turn-helix transcriptional regulator [Kitasatospora sp. NPDC057223]|uniref:MarR family winged helix-turn-helix transcriptional regulator n=1 Tax=Kitasatospora sp. NPDC057223 TaxID=3346055 RepID=UPI0036403DA1